MCLSYIFSGSKLLYWNDKLVISSHFAQLSLESKFEGNYNLALKTTFYWKMYENGLDKYTDWAANLHVTDRSKELTQKRRVRLTVLAARHKNL